MNQNDRDTRFAGFAKVLIQDLNTQGFDQDGYRSAEDTQRIIAQRAYDLVDHTITALWPYINDTAIDPSPADIPDLTE